MTAHPFANRHKQNSHRSTLPTSSTLWTSILTLSSLLILQMGGCSVSVVQKGTPCTKERSCPTGMSCEQGFCEGVKVVPEKLEKPPLPPSPCPDNRPPTDEVCDGEDNNCDGQIDEGLFLCVTTHAGHCGIRDQTYKIDKAGYMNTPVGLLLDQQGRLLYSDHSQRILRVNPDGKIITIAGDAGLRGSINNGSTPPRLNFPHGMLWVTNERLLFADFGGGQLRTIIFPQIQLETTAGSTEKGFADGFAQARFHSPHRLLSNKQGQIFVSDFRNNSIRRLDPDGKVTTIAGDKEAGYIDGNAKDARFKAPIGLAFDDQSNLYIADNENQLIRKLSPTGVVSTFAGRPPSGTDSSTPLAGPHDLIWSPKNVLYVTEFIGHRLKQIDPTGKITLLAGTGEKGFRNGPAHQAQFNGPHAMALSPDGTLYIADAFNHCIRKMKVFK